MRVLLLMPVGLIIGAAGGFAMWKYAWPDLFGTPQGGSAVVTPTPVQPPPDPAAQPAPAVIPTPPTPAPAPTPATVPAPTPAVAVAPAFPADQVRANLKFVYRCWQDAEMSVEAIDRLNLDLHRFQERQMTQAVQDAQNAIKSEQAKVAENRRRAIEILSAVAEPWRKSPQEAGELLKSMIAEAKAAPAPRTQELLERLERTMKDLPQQQAERDYFGKFWDERFARKE